MKRLQTGLTVLELMMTLAMAATLTAVGVPQFRGLALDVRRSEVSGSLHDAMQQARMEAITRNVDVVIAANGDDWSGGWTVYVDADADNLPDFQPLLEADAVHDAVAVRATVLSMRFQGSGRATQPARMALCGDNAQHTRLIEADLSGRIALRDADDQDFAAECPAA